MDYTNHAPELENDSEPTETPSPSPICVRWNGLPEAPPITYNWVDVTAEFVDACKGKCYRYYY